MKEWGAGMCTNHPAAHRVTERNCVGTTVAAWAPERVTVRTVCHPLRYNGKVARTAPFGAFVTVTLDSGAQADGLVHVSKIKDTCLMRGLESREQIVVLSHWTFCFQIEFKSATRRAQIEFKRTTGYTHARMWG